MTLLNVFPVFSANYKANAVVRNIELLGNGSLRKTTFVHISNFNDIILGKLGFVEHVASSFSSSCATLTYFVDVTVKISTKKKMFRIYTLWIVAFMKHVQTILYRPVRKF